VDDFISHLSVTDKVKLLGQQDVGSINGTSLWPRGYHFWNEALHGLCKGCASPTKGGCTTGRCCATQFPAPNGLGCAMNRTLWKAIGTAISTEARTFYKYNADVNGLGFFAPQLNLWANPLWGRNMEAPGEDPFVVGEYGKAWVRGMQGEGGEGGAASVSPGGRPYLKAYATPKHFVGQVLWWESLAPPAHTNSTSRGRRTRAAASPTALCWSATATTRGTPCTTWSGTCSRSARR
jgi:hypothetical protein